MRLPQLMNSSTQATVASCALIITHLVFTPFCAGAQRSTELLPSLPFITTIAPQRTLENLRLPSQTVERLMTFTQQVEQRSTYQAPNRKSPRTFPQSTAIFTGLDHKGKLAAAEAVAAELKRPLHKIDVLRLATKYIGETEKNLDSFFHKAERQGAILFFDEADALFGKRTKVSDAHDKYANIETNYLLEKLRKYDGLVILSTSDRQNLEESKVLKITTSVAFPCAAFQNC